MSLNLIYKTIITKYNINYYINYYFYYFRDYFDYYRLQLINKFNNELEKNKYRMGNSNHIYYNYIYDSNFELIDIKIENTSLTNNNIDYYFNLTYRQQNSHTNDNRENYYTYIEDLV